MTLPYCAVQYTKALGKLYYSFTPKYLGVHFYTLYFRNEEIYVKEVKTTCLNYTSCLGFSAFPKNHLIKVWLTFENCVHFEFKPSSFAG